MPGEAERLPNFVTEIDGLDIHFLHVRSRHENALPLIATHGWPGSIIEQLKIIGPLTDPTAHGATAADAFDLVIPSLPGPRRDWPAFTPTCPAPPRPPSTPRSSAATRRRRICPPRSGAPTGS